ncbi:MAG: acyl-CoA dehydrogenase family protein [Candidatus Nanopelagicales bacterium]
MLRDLFTPEQDEYRAVVRTFCEKEIEPHLAEWEEAGIAPKDLYRQLGALGATGIQIPEEYGGGGEETFRFNAILDEELARLPVHLGGIGLHLDIVVPYLLELATPEQRDRWFPGIASGDLVTCIGMTEPGTGSDLAGISTTAVRDGDHYVVNGAKTFITGGVNADLAVVVVRTGKADDRRGGLSLLVVEDGTPGYDHSRKLHKLGMWATDTAELFFDDVRVPVTNLLGEEGKGFEYLTMNLPQERLSIAVGAVAASQAAIERTVAYVHERHAFGKPIASFQNTKFELASMAAEVEAAQAMVDKGIVELDAKRLTAADAAKLKLFTTELQGRVMDRCLQLFGGYGYMQEYPIAKMYADARVTRIYGGTSEIMKVIIAQAMGL